jgi:hypothetical protein
VVVEDEDDDEVNKAPVNRATAIHRERIVVAVCSFARVLIVDQKIYLQGR